MELAFLFTNATTNLRYPPSLVKYKTLVKAVGLGCFALILYRSLTDV